MFLCDGSFYLSQNPDSPPTTTYRILYDGSVVEFETVASHPYQLNATGYHRPTGSIISVRRGTNQFVQLFADGTHGIIGTEPSITQWSAYSADCTPDGTYVLTEGDDNSLRFYQIEPTFELLTSVELTWAPGSGNTGTVDLLLNDIAVDPDNPDRIFTYQRNFQTPGWPTEPVSTRGYLLLINGDMNDPGFGEVIPVGHLDGSVINQMGSLFFDHGGNLYGYGSVVFPNHIQERFVGIDKETGDVWHLATGPVAVNTDGCSCPYGIDLLLEVLDISLNCGFQTILLEATVSSNSEDVIHNAVIRDTLPDGLKFLQIDLNGMDGIVSLNNDSTELEIQGITLEPGSIQTFYLTVRAPNITAMYLNQAHLSNLPFVYGEDVPSDDPTTHAFNDPVRFETIEYVSDYQGEVTATICDNELYDYNGNFYPPNSTHEILLANAALDGCDSLVVLNIAGLPVNSSDVPGSFCDGDSYVLHGQTYTQPGVYNISLANGSQNGCDSLIILNLEQLPVSDSFFEALICPGDSVQVNGQWYTTDFSDLVILENGSVNGCDSLLYINIAVDSDLQEYLDIDICEGGSYFVNGEEFSTPGSYEVYMPNGSINGCDSTVYLELQTTTLVEETVSAEVCFGDSLEFHGEFYSLSGMYETLLPGAAAGGCDSLVILELEQLPLVESMVDATFCEGDEFAFNGEIYTEAGQYEITLPQSSHNGCDSTIQLTLESEAALDSFLTEELCHGDQLMIEDTVLTTSGMYEFQLEGGLNECGVNLYVDLVIHPDLEIQYQDYFEGPVGSVVSFNIESNSGIASINWVNTSGMSCFDCFDPDVIITGSQKYPFTLWDSLGCNISGLIEIRALEDTASVYVPNVFTPNGDGINDLFFITGKNITEIESLQIFDRWGELVYEDEGIIMPATDVGWDGTFRGDRMTPAVFVYVIRYRTTSGTIQIVAGDVTLLR